MGKEESKKQRVLEDKKEKVRILKIVQIAEPKPDLPKPNKRKQRKDAVYNLAKKIWNVEIQELTVEEAMDTVPMLSSTLNEVNQANAFSSILEGIVKKAIAEI